MANTYTMDEINCMDSDQFIAVLGNIVEHCSLLAATLWAQRPFPNVKDLHEGFCHLIDSLPESVHEGILRSHPDLAGRLASEGLLTTDSTSEQESAGLGTLTTEEYTTLTRNNDRYKDKFGFPFTICARENKKEAILEGISNRLGNSHEIELRTGIEEVKKIGFYRLIGIVKGN